MGAHWALAGARGERAAGNGAAMRIAPLAFLLDPENSSQRLLIRDVSRITHHNEEAYVGALAVIYAIRFASANKPERSSELLELVSSKLPDSKTRDNLYKLSILTEVTDITQAVEVSGNSGYVAESVPLAIYCAQLASSFSLKTIFSSAIQAGGDTDTIASITGQITGAFIGFDSISKDTFVGIQNIECVIDMAKRFANYASSKLN